jgi:hypothetical protein
MKKLQIIIFCFCVFLFAQEENSNKRRVSFGFRQGGGIGLSVLKENYKNSFEQVEESIDENDNYYSRVIKYRDGSGSFDNAYFLSLQLTKHFAVQTEALFTKYCDIGFDANIKYKTSETPDTNYQEYTQKQSQPALIFPVLAKLTINPKNISIQAFIGPHFTIDFGYDETKIKTETYSSIFKKSKDFNLYNLLGLTAGGRFGVKAGNGITFLDVRYFTDITEKSIRRARLSLTAGYEFCLGSK